MWAASRSCLASPVALTAKKLSAMQETQVESLGQEYPLEKEMQYFPLQYCCLGNPTDSGSWQAIIHGVPKRQT